MILLPQFPKYSDDRHVSIVPGFAQLSVLRISLARLWVAAQGDVSLENFFWMAKSEQKDSAIDAQSNLTTQ